MVSKKNLNLFSTKVKLKSIIFSLFGIFSFFINITINSRKTVPMVHIMDFIKKLLTRPVVNVLVMISCIMVLIMSIISKFDKEKKFFISQYYKKDNIFSYFMYLTAAIFSIMIVFNIGPDYIIVPKVGTSSITVAGDVLFSVTVAGTLVTFLLEFGFFEFLGYLIEPIMRKVFLLPGKSAVDALSSFVASPAVGVMITNDLYKRNEYTKKEACSITTNFSVCSLGAFAFLSATAGVEQYYTKIVFSGLLIAFLMAIIMVRIPPLSRKDSVYYNNKIQTSEERASIKYHKGMIKEALFIAFEKTRNTKTDIFIKGFTSSFMFGIKVVSYIVSLSVFSLIIANYTSIVKYIGMPMIPILKILNIPNAEIIAPSTLVGIFGLAIPTILIKGKSIAAVSSFFVVVLSTSQIIFFTESANAMLESEIPLSFLDLVYIFFIRTIFLIPIIALVTKIIF